MILEKLPLLLVLITLSSVFTQANSPLRYKEEWVPYVPFSTWVGLMFWIQNETAYVNVTITFPTAGYNVSDWGTAIIKEDYDIWADSEIWQWTGVSIQVITKYSHTYELGHLKQGNYTFTFGSWGYPVKSLAFDVLPLLSDVNDNAIYWRTRLGNDRQIIPL